MIREEGEDGGLDVAEKWYEASIDEKFWFSDELPQENVYPWMVKTINAGAKSVMPINEDIFEERGLDIPDSYNDLFDDQYEGLEMGLASYVVGHQAGYIMRYHAAQTEMEPNEWMRELIDHLEFVGTTGARRVAQGEIPVMFYNGPNTIMPFMGESPMYANYVEGVKGSTWKNELSINQKAPNPWLARFFVSAVLEEPVQRRILTEAPQATPGRTDLDYDISDPFIEKTMTTDYVALDFWEGTKYIETAAKAKENNVFDY
jgi:ABC-type Fe3+ transport system substrate-binding protein